MEHIEQSDSKADTPLPLSISPDARALWPSLRNWTLFLAVSCFFGAGIFAFFCTAMIFVANNYSRANNYQTAPNPGLILGLYGILVVVLVLLGLLFLFVGNTAKRAGLYGRPEHVRRLSGSTLLYFRVAGVFGLLGFLFQIWWLFQVLSL